MKKYSLEWTVFICGAVVMVLELVGSRILAPHVGTSIVVWTSLIGIILGSLSAGYYWGGKLADKNARPEALARIILVSAVLVVFTAIFKEPVLSIFTKFFNNIYVTTILATMILFAPSSVALGMISPYAAKLKMHDTEHAGATIGTLYALSTIGSIVGTFLAGFFLVAYFGSTVILYVLAIILVLTTVLIHRGKLALRMVLLALIAIIGSFSVFFGALAKASGVIDVDTNYQRVQIYPITYKNRPVRILRTEIFGVQSGMYLDGDTSELVFDYLKMYNLVEHFQPQLKRSLLIGGAAYSYPKAYLKRFRDAQLDVVELDPGLTDLARKYFNLVDDPRLHIFHEDGRIFLNQVAPATYGAVFIDAFSSLTIPYQLTTREAVQKVSDSLQENGVVLVNIVGAFQGVGSEFFRAEYATYKKVFPQVYAFWVKSDKDTEVQNIMLVATKSKASLNLATDSPEIAQFLKQLWAKEITTDLPILTDEHAPVERYMMGVY